MRRRRDGTSWTPSRSAAARPATFIGVATALLLGCGSDQDVTFTSAEPPEPASARLFINGGDVTHHVPLNTGFSQEVEVRLHAANGARIASYDDHFVRSSDVIPASLATASDVAGGRW